jgi:hypothetical protein
MQSSWRGSYVVRVIDAGFAAARHKVVAVMA